MKYTMYIQCFEVQEQATTEPNSIFIIKKMYVPNDSSYDNLKMYLSKIFSIDLLL